MIMAVWILICTTITLGVAQVFSAVRVRNLQARVRDLEIQVIDLENPL